jgi:TonB family protein
MTIISLIMSSIMVGNVLAWSAALPPSTSVPQRSPLAQMEKKLRRVPAHISEFAPVSEPLALAKCGDVRPPEALLTPDPLLHAQSDDLDDLKVRVSFIVGADGRVHSAFVLDSGGADEDLAVLRAVRYWRYRPALCNGVPTDAEALVRFSIH